MRPCLADVTAYGASRMRTPMLILLALLPMLAACGSDKRPVQSASVPVAPAPRPQTRQHSRVPPVRQPLRRGWQDYSVVST